MATNVPSHLAPLLGGLEKYFGSGEYSDFTVRCKEDTYKVHKLAFCAQSPFFERACKKGFKEGDSGILDLKEEDPLAVKIMIYFLYHFRYPTPPNEETPLEYEHSLFLHAKVYAIADQYQVASLKESARQKFETLSVVNWDTVDFIEAACEIYTNAQHNDGVFRDLVAKRAAEHSSELLTGDDTENDFKTLLFNECPEFVRDFALELAAIRRGQKSTGVAKVFHKCPNPYCLKLLLNVGAPEPGFRGHPRYTCSLCGKLSCVSDWEKYTKVG